MDLKYWENCARIALNRGVELDEWKAIAGRTGATSFYFHDRVADTWVSPYFNNQGNDLCIAWELEQEHNRSYITDEIFMELWGDIPDPLPEVCPCEYCQIEHNPDEWLTSMEGATEWEDWDWEESPGIPYF